MMNSLSASVRLAKMSCIRRVLLGSFHSLIWSSDISIYMVFVLPVKGDVLITSLMVRSYQKMHVIVNPSQSDTKLANGIHFMLPWGVEMCLSRTQWQAPYMEWCICIQYGSERRRNSLWRLTSLELYIY